MRIVVVAVGSTGDVLPYTGLASALRARGHQVAIASHPQFAQTVQARGAEFRALAMDIRTELSSQRGQRALRTSVRGTAGAVALYTRHWQAMGEAIEKAVADADLVLVSALGWQGIHVAEAMGVPSMGVYLQPLDPTGEFPPWMVARRSLGRRGNRAAANAVRVLGQVPFRRVTADLRRRLGLEPIGIRRFFRRLDRQRWPVLYGFSPTVLPAPHDWPSWRSVAGYWWPTPDPGWTPSPDLLDYLEAGPPPVLVTLGSMTLQDTDRHLRRIQAAVRSTGQRALVQAGWADLSGSSDEQVLVIGAADHGWLLQRVTAALHHAGAGTTAACLRAGVPAIPVPVAADQPFWAQRLAELGVAPGSVPLRRIDTTALGTALDAVLHRPFHRARARDVAARIAGEDGDGVVADAVGSGRFL